MIQLFEYVGGLIVVGVVCFILGLSIIVSVAIPLAILVGLYLLTQALGVVIVVGVCVCIGVGGVYLDHVIKNAKVTNEKL